MDKEEILKKNKDDNKNLDEREEQEMGNGFGFGGVIVAVLCCVFSIINALQGKRFYEFGVILFGYLAGSAWYSYRITKKKNHLIRAFACSFATFFGFVAFFLLR